MKKPKMSALVASAIRNLREIRGSTSKEIMNYIKSQFNTPDANVQKQIYTALKRGLEYGILKRDRGYYSLNLDSDMLYNAPSMPPLEQGRRRSRGRRRGRGRRRSRRRGRRSRVSRRARGRGRRRRGRGRRSRGRGRSRRGRSRRGRGRRGRTSVRTRSLAAKCKFCAPRSRKRMEDTLRKSPIQSLQEDITYLYKKGTKKTPSSHSNCSHKQIQMHSRSISSDKEMIDNRRDRDQSWKMSGDASSF